MCSNYRRRHWDYRLVPGWYQLVPRTIHESTVYMYEYIWYVLVPEAVAYVWIFVVWRTWENICIYLII